MVRFICTLKLDFKIIIPISQTQRSALNKAAVHMYIYSSKYEYIYNFNDV